MQIDSIRILLNNKIKTFNTKFYKNCIKYFDNEENYDNLIKKRLMENKYVFETIRLFITESFNKYICFITDISVLEDKIQKDYIIKNSFIRDMSHISSKCRNNLLRQLHVIETDNLESFKDDDVINKFYPNIKSILFIFLPLDNTDLDNNKFIRISNSKSLHLFLGTEVLKFLEYQNLDRFVEYMKSTKLDAIKSVNMFRDFYNFMKLLPYERIMMFSGFTLHTLGTSYTSDADTIYWTKGEKSDEISRIVKLIKTRDYIELFVYDKDSKDIELFGNFITDPDDHYYFVGIKIY